MNASIQIGGISIAVIWKNINGAQLYVDPPDGSVTLYVPEKTPLESARVYAVKKLGWILVQQEKLRQHIMNTEGLIDIKSDYLWGDRYIMSVLECDARPSVTVGCEEITITVRPGTDHARRRTFIHEWHKKLMDKFISGLIREWEPRLDVKVTAYVLQRMRNRWGNCYHKAGHIFLNTNLVKKPRELTEYVVVHEMIHLIEPTHNQGFVSLITEHFPTWREARARLNDLNLQNDLPLQDEDWRE
ncbi:MAG: M48 family metallopeptidase [Desulfamplus sp.]|nr:M48 family metallopeptidase [Desulfamplus sp.]